MSQQNIDTAATEYAEVMNRANAEYEARCARSLIEHTLTVSRALADLERARCIANARFAEAVK